MDSDQSSFRAIEISLLEKIKEICQKLDLTYYAACGTLLGAVRHQGFIPWDDDMDLFLPWPDYQKLMEAAPRECHYPFFFQSLYTEQSAMANACRLRRSDTTGFTRWELENVEPGYDLGIFIDIFPLFFVPDPPEERAKQKEKVLHLWRCISGHNALIRQKRGQTVNKDYESFIPEYLSLCKGRGVVRADDPDIVWLKEEYLKACAWDGKKTKEVGTTSSKCHDPKLMWDSEWFERTVELPFESTTICCPGEYERILEKQYGDWRVPVMGGGEHEMVVIDTQKPWKEFISEQARTHDRSARPRGVNTDLMKLPPE